MRLLDKLYLNIYWYFHSSKYSFRSTRQRGIDETLERFFTLVLFGVLMIIIIGPMFFFNFEEEKRIIIASVSGVIGFLVCIFIPFIITDKYYTEKRRKLILNKYPIPGGIRYLIVALMIIVSMAMLAIAMVIILVFIDPSLIFG